MKTPEVVVFDLGKVLVDFDYSIAARKFAAKGRVTPQQVREFIDHSSLLFRFETGLMSRAEFYSEVCAATGYAGCETEFCEIFSDIFTPIDEMVEINSRLRAQNIPTYIFSNTNELAVAHIRRQFPFFAEFTDYVLSYQHGAMKPDAKIYEVVERISGRRGAAILYLDDREENVEAGAARGWHTILHRTPAASRQIMRDLALLPL